MMAAPYAEGGPGFARGSATSKEAAGSISHDSPILRARVLADIRNTTPPTWGATCEETERRLGLSHQTCSARFTELKRLGLISPLERSPEGGGGLTRRRNRSGRWATVYVAVEATAATRPAVS